jgi:Apea-like HEPN
MKSTFIALAHNLNLLSDLGIGDKIRGEMRITNNRAVISSLLSSEYVRIIGEMEVASLLGGKPVIYSVQDIPDDTTPLQLLVSKLYEVQSFLLTTWLFLDNSINTELGFLLYSGKGGATASSNFIAHLYSDSRGRDVVTEITRDELRQMRTLHRSAIGMPDHPFSLPTSQLTSAHPRLPRALYLINAARGEPDLAMRVASYCTAFETLFATSQSELAHQLAERIACFLHKDATERLSIYRKLKNAYNLRSKVVHGATVRANKLDDVADTSEFCDATLRAIIYRLLTEEATRSMFEKNSEAFDEYMLTTIFSNAS